MSKSKERNGGAFLILGDVVFVSPDGGGMHRMTTSEAGKFDVYTWDGTGWAWKDNVCMASAKRMLMGSWHVYARIKT